MDDAIDSRPNLKIIPKKVLIAFLLQANNPMDVLHMNPSFELSFEIDLKGQFQGYLSVSKDKILFV